MSTSTLEEEVAPPEVDADKVREVLEYYWAKEWTDGLPVVPATETYVTSSSRRWRATRKKSSSPSPT